MREILYKGKRVDNGEWVYGLPYKAKYGCISSIVNDDEERFLIFPETVGQFTGLTDKNGTKIFESDIVRITTGIKGYESTYHSAIQKVRYETDEYGIALFYPFDNSDMVEVEVIGNIYDNPELLEVGV